MNEKLSVEQANSLAQEGARWRFSPDARGEEEGVGGLPEVARHPIGADLANCRSSMKRSLTTRNSNRRQFRLTQADGMSPGPEPLGGEWEAVADRLSRSHGCR